jgi:hypothetical protein
MDAWTMRHLQKNLRRQWPLGSPRAGLMMNAAMFVAG